MLDLFTSYYLLAADPRLQFARCAVPTRRRIPAPGEFPDALKEQLAVGRAEVILAAARARMAERFTLGELTTWMQPVYFPTPETSFPATLCEDFRIPTLDVDAQFQPFLKKLQDLNADERFALCDAMEAAWYFWLPAGRHLPGVFDAYGMPLRKGSK